MSFNVKSEILSAIAKTESVEMKTVLLLMLGVLEEIGGKVDAVLNNEKALRSMVLNGHEANHHDHHNWVDKWEKREPEVEKVINWASAKIREEEEDRRNVRKQLTDSLFKALGVLLLIGIGAFIGRGGV